MVQYASPREKISGHDRGSSLCPRSALSRLTMGRSIADRGLLSTLDGLWWHSGYSAVASTSFSRAAPAVRRSW